MTLGSRAVRLLAILSLAITALSSAGTAHAQDERIQIAVSTPLLADIVRTIAGDEAEVFSVMPESADPHTWEATPSDIVRAAEADSFISVGAHLEPFVESGGWRRAIIDGKVPQLILADHIDLIEIDKVIDHGDHVHDLREGDPHFWLDPGKVIETLPAIAAHLATIKPESASIFEANAAAYTTALQELDTELATSFAAIPEERRVLVVFHDAYTYFAARYDFEVIGVVLKNPDAEISAQEVVELQGIIEENDVPVIFAEPQFNTDVLQVFVEENDVAIGELLTDSFGDRVDSYIDLMRYNRDSLVTHLA